MNKKGKEPGMKQIETIFTEVCAEDSGKYLFRVYAALRKITSHTSRAYYLDRPMYLKKKKKYVYIEFFCNF